MTEPAALGFATIFPGWNVWAVRQKNDLDFEGPLMIGVGADRLLRIWVESMVERAPGVAVRDTEFNPLQLRGDMIEIIPGSAGLAVFEDQQTQLPGGGLLVGNPSTVRFVRFFNRGEGAITPWPYSKRDFGTENHMLETVFAPEKGNALTDAPAPGSLAGSAGDAGKALGKGITTLLVGVGVIAVAVVVLSQAGKGR